MANAGLAPSVIAALGRIVAAGRIGASAARLTAALACVALAALVVMGAVGCALAALWIAILPQVGPAYAPLIVAGVLVVIGLALLVAARLLTRRKKPAASLSATADLLLAEGTRFFASHKSEVLLAALLAGLLSGGKPRR
jgi:hypothetical protein